MCAVKFKSFEEINIGDSNSFEVLITEDLHQRFSDLFGDYSPIHTDEKFAAGTKFQKRIGYAFMLTGFLSKFYGEYLPGGSSICIKQDANFIKPFHIGDNLTIKGEVVNKSEATRFVKINTEVIRNDVERVFEGKGIVQVVFDSCCYEELFSYQGEKISKYEFSKALKKLGIKQGDMLFVHSDITVFGKLLLKDKKKLLNTLNDSIFESVGSKGTVIMPTFSYSFCDSELFDSKNTKSKVGVLTEIFRNRHDVSRTCHPIFSVAIWGSRKDELLDISKDSFDKHSIFGKLHKNNGKILFFGASFQSCTYLHYIEQMHNVPYRYIKSFRGIIIDQGKQYEDEYTYYVRDLDKDVALDTSRLEEYLQKNDLLKTVTVGNGKIKMIEAEKLFDESTKLLKNNEFYFLKNPV